MSITLIFQVKNIIMGIIILIKKNNESDENSNLQSDQNLSLVTED